MLDKKKRRSRLAQQQIPLLGSSKERYEDSEEQTIAVMQLENKSSPC